MIRVTIELFPMGDETKRREIGKMDIFNDASGSAKIGNYGVRLYKTAEFSEKNAGKLWRRGEVLGFPRLKLGPYDLLYRALADTVGDRNPEEAT